MFEEMMTRFEEETVRYLYLMQVIDADGTENGSAAAELRSCGEIFGRR